MKPEQRIALEERLAAATAGVPLDQAILALAYLIEDGADTFRPPDVVKRPIRRVDADREVRRKLAGRLRDMAENYGAWQKSLRTSEKGVA